jgi:chlorobactene glucosyltransferase
MDWGWWWSGPVCLFWGGALLKAIRRRQTNVWRLGPESPGPASQARVAAIVPARNEAANIGLCLDGLLAQDIPGLRIYVIDDGSTDGTSQILEERARSLGDRLVLISGGGGALPEGWFGKPWACHRAALRALQDQPDWLLFVDADVRLEPRCASAAVGHAEARGLALLSGFGSLELVTFWEKVLQPVIAGMIISGADLDRVNDPARRPRPPIANGQLLLFSRAGYEAVGGHEAVARNVLDDVGLAAAVVDKGLDYHILYMTTLFRCRMYTGLGEIWSGWSKNLYAGLGHSWALVLALSTFTALTSLGPYLAIPLGLAGLVPGSVLWGGIGAVLLIQTLRFYLDGVFQQDRRYGLSHALGAAILVPLLINSALAGSRGNAVWKGRVLARA